MSRQVAHTALKAQSYVEERLLLSRLDYSQPLETRPGNEQILVELDGCQIRTGTLIPIEKAEVTKKRRLTKRQREPEEREVRVGLARPLQDKEKRTYVARMSKYPEVVGQLVSAAVGQGMSARTQIIAVADGAIGLREALEAQFSNLTFILDPTGNRQFPGRGKPADD